MIETKQIAFQLGLLFLGAVVFGRLARFFKIPRVAGYLIGGIVFGPYALGWLEESVIETLQPAKEFALALIIFEIGTKFEISRLKRQGSFLLRLVFADVGITSLLVFFAVLIFSGNLTIALMLGVLAIATAPAATMLVLKEFRAEGEVTDSIISLVGINNIVCIILFEIAIALLSAGGGFFVTIGAISTNLFFILIAMILGVVGGLVISYLEQKVTGPERFILFLGIIVAIFGASLWLGLSFMLVFLVMGIALVNVSEYTQEVMDELDKIGWPLYVLFFLLAGAKLDLGSMKSMGVVSLVYLMARTIGKVGGLGAVSCYDRKVPESLKNIGWGMLSQAGLAVGLAMICVQKLGYAGVEIETVIVSTIVIFETVGSVLVKITVVRAGEVKLVNLLDRTVASPYALSLRNTTRKLLTKFGIGPWENPKHIERLRVKDAMLKNIRAIPVNANFDEIMHTIAHSRFNNFPVIGAEGHFEGLISYSELREVIYDPTLAMIMIAKDFARLKDYRVNPEMDLRQALEIFKKTNMDVLPVVESGKEKFVGLLEQREVLRLVGKKK